MAPAVTSVIFDVGGVLLDWDPRLVYRTLIEDPAVLEWFLAEVCTHDWNLTLDAGRPFDEACRELAERHPGQAELIHAWKRQDEMVAGEVPGMDAVVRGLKHHGTGLFLLTNMPAHVFQERRRRYAILRQFDGAVVSGEEGVLKPSPEIFGRLTERFRLEPARSLFVDDAEVNVAGARAAGFEAHHFVDVPSLVAALKGYGFDSVGL